MSKDKDKKEAPPPELTNKERRKIAAKADKTREQSRAALRKLVHIFYDFQKLRMQTAGRTTRKAEDADVQLHEVDKAVMEGRAKELHQVEKEALLDIQSHLKTMPFYKAVLSDKSVYKGIGPTLAGVLLSEFDIYRHDTPSQMWAFAGLAPVNCKRCKHCQIPCSEDKEKRWKHDFQTGACDRKFLKPSDMFASGKQMRPKKGEKLKYNAWLRSKMCGVMGPCLLKSNSPWREFYDNYKHRKESAGWGMSQAHRHQAAIRYMVKQLLLNIWTKWRKFEGLPVRAPYQEEYLGHVHHSKQDISPESDPEEEMMTPEVEEELKRAV
jgi:hypothetical protein